MCVYVMWCACVCACQRKAITRASAALGSPIYVAGPRPPSSRPSRPQVESAQSRNDWIYSPVHRNFTMAGACGSTCPVEGGFYTYEPNIVGNAVLLAAFGILVPAVALLGFRFRTPVFSATLVTGLLLATIGFVGRVLLNDSPRSQVYFVLSLLGTVLGPVCTIGAVFLTLPHILSIYGDHVSPIHPAWAGAVFYGLEVVAAVIQLVGVIFVAHDLTSIGVRVD